MHRYICKCWKLTNTLVVYEDVPSATIIHRPIHPLIVLFISGLIEGATKSMTSTVSWSIFFTTSWHSRASNSHTKALNAHSIALESHTVAYNLIDFHSSYHTIAYQSIHKHSMHDDFNWVLNFFIEKIHCRFLVDSVFL